MIEECKAGLIDHLQRIAALDKVYAWWAAKNYAAMDVCFADIPQLLTEKMNEGKQDRREPA